MTASADISQVCGRKQHRYHSADACCGVIGTDSGEAHALRETDDLCHAVNVASAADSFSTMIDGAFQGAA